MLWPSIKFQLEATLVNYLLEDQFQLFAKDTQIYHNFTMYYISRRYDWDEDLTNSFSLAPGVWAQNHPTGRVLTIKLYEVLSNTLGPKLPVRRPHTFTTNSSHNNTHVSTIALCLQGWFSSRCELYSPSTIALCLFNRYIQHTFTWLLISWKFSDWLFS